MIQHELRLSEGQTLELIRLAEEEGVPIEEVVRRLVVQALDRASEVRVRYARAAQLVGAFADRGSH